MTLSLPTRLLEESSGAALSKEAQRGSKIQMKAAISNQNCNATPQPYFFLGAVAYTEKAMVASCWDVSLKRSSLLPKYMQCQVSTL